MLWKKNPMYSNFQPTSKNNNKNHFSRSASVRGNNKKNKQSISYENNFYDMTSMSNGGHRRGPIWSKPHPHQSLNAKVSVSGGPPEPPPRQPLQRLNAISTLWDISPFRRLLIFLRNTQNLKYQTQQSKILCKNVFSRMFGKNSSFKSA